jgi:hypothetical protein
LPAQPDAPIVVHLVDWSEDPQPFTVSLNPQTLFAGRPLSVSLITPEPYERQAHEAAFESGDYSVCSKEVPLATGHVTTCQLPPLRPWGLLVLRPLPNQAGLWPPRFASVDHQGVPAICVLSPDRDATLRYTTNGSEPTQDSPVYREPISVESCKEIRARSYREGAASSVSALPHLPAIDLGATSLIVNGDFSQGIEGWRRVVSKEIGIPDALEFAVERVESRGDPFAARLSIKASDGVPYHLRLVQPVLVANQANLYVTATLSANRPTRVRFGIQERSAPYRVVHLGILQIGTEPRRFRLSMSNPHPDLSAQVQLDLGSCAPDTTVWLSDVTVRELGTRKTVIAPAEDSP